MNETSLEIRIAIIEEKSRAAEEALSLFRVELARRLGELNSHAQTMRDLQGEYVPQAVYAVDKMRVEEQISVLKAQVTEINLVIREVKTRLAVYISAAVAVMAVISIVLRFFKL